MEAKAILENPAHNIPPITKMLVRNNLSTVHGAIKKDIPGSREMLTVIRDALTRILT